MAKPMEQKKKGLTGIQKAALFLVAIGSEASAEVFKHLKDDEIEKLTLEISRLPRVDAGERDSIMMTFQEMMVAQEFITVGGVDYAREVLEKSLGQQKAVDIITRLTSHFQMKPFELVKRTDPNQLLNFIQNEHPQTIALILAFLPPEKASVILAQLPTEIQSEVAKRMALMKTTSPDVLREIERVLEKKLSSLISAEYTQAGGIDAIVEVLNKVDRGTEKSIMEALEEKEPELAEEIKKKMFVFEDIIMLNDRDMQTVLREVDTAELAYALKAVDDDVKEKIFKNMSKRAAAMLKDEIEFMGPVRMRDVEEAQQKIVNIIRSLEESGEIVMARGGEEEIVY